MGLSWRNVISQGLSLLEQSFVVSVSLRRHWLTRNLFNVLMRTFINNGVRHNQWPKRQLDSISIQVNTLINAFLFKPETQRNMTDEDVIGTLLTLSYTLDSSPDLFTYFKARKGYRFQWHVPYPCLKENHNLFSFPRIWPTELRVTREVGSAYRSRIS